MQNVIERAVILVRGGQQLRFDVVSRLPASANAVDQNQAFSDQASSHQVMPVERERQRRERDIRNIENALRHTRGRIAGPGGAAELLGVKPSTLRSRIKVYGISPKPLVVEENLAH